MNHKSMVDEIVKRAVPRSDDDETGEEEAAPSDLLMKAEALLDVLDPYGAPSEPEPAKDETPIQRKQREIDHRANVERRRLKAELLLDAVKDLFDALEAQPHSEGPHK